MRILIHHAFIPGFSSGSQPGREAVAVPRQCSESDAWGWEATSHTKHQLAPLQMGLKSFSEPSCTLNPTPLIWYALDGGYTWLAFQFSASTQSQDVAAPPRVV